MSRLANLVREPAKLRRSPALSLLRYVFKLKRMTGKCGDTIFLASVPKSRGRDEAVAVAQQARSRGLRQVGVLDSSVFASLRPGYWMTFTGKYETEAEATSVLRRARAAVKGARVAQVSS